MYTRIYIHRLEDLGDTVNSKKFSTCLYTVYTHVHALFLYLSFSLAFPYNLECPLLSFFLFLSRASLFPTATRPSSLFSTFSPTPRPSPLFLSFSLSLVYSFSGRTRPNVQFSAVIPRRRRPSLSLFLLYLSRR